MYLSVKDWNKLRDIEQKIYCYPSLIEEHQELLDILLRLDEERISDNAKVWDKIRERRKIDKNYGR